MSYYAVIDTNVLVAALLAKKEGTATVEILHAVLDGRITPLYHMHILNEYDDVLHRDKFPLREETIHKVLSAIVQFGVEVVPRPTDETLADRDDQIFYETAMGKRADNAYLITGNQKHYPKREFIVSPAEMIKILDTE